MARSIEHIKQASHHLRGQVYDDLYHRPESGVSEESRQLMKFFGMYQQEDRDFKKLWKSEGKEPEHRFMVRVALAGGDMTADQYLALDALADAVGLGHFRLTSRQAVQIHGVHKGDLPALVQRLHQTGATSLAGCGDVERNVMCCPAPDAGGVRDEVRALAHQLASDLKPQTRAYLELFVEGRKVLEAVEEEPLYGEAYLPRKFKTGMAIAGDNCVDVYSHDIGLVAHPSPGGHLEAVTVLVGGGLGHSHGVQRTHPVLAQPLGTIAAEEVGRVATAIVTVQRDYGNREDRRFARMKYLVEAWGIDAFREEVERRAGLKLDAPRELTWQDQADHLGYHPLSDAKGYLGIYIPGGRIVGRLKETLRELVAEYRPHLRATPQQNLLWLDLTEREAQTIQARLEAAGCPPAETLSPTRRISMACVALPTCGLALAEAERVFFPLHQRIEEEWTTLGLREVPLVVRMTGCPNNCVRSELAEIGFVGSAPGRYHIYLGGNRSGTRLSRKFRERVPYEELFSTIQPLLHWYARERAEGQGFGDWVEAMGVDTLAARLEEVRS
ncbi:MAG: NADPH-dependent assimilatory sulfite reductase hemoprotein subunit [Firmicutes bacterium]|nr:NADPH-dependent assimilatory sulfite reductase hemoprotein subunit [Bacillota bacterium]